MARQKKSMIGFDPLAWLDDDKSKNNSVEESEAPELKDKKNQSSSNKKSQKASKVIIQFLDKKIDESALLKGYSLLENNIDSVFNNFERQLTSVESDIKEAVESGAGKLNASQLEEALTLMMDGLHDEANFKISLTEKAEYFQQQGVLPKHYLLTAEVFVASCKEAFGRSWTKAVSAAWMETLAGVAETICAAYKDEEVESENIEMETAIMSDDESIDVSENDNVESDHPILQLNSIQDISKSQALKNDMLMLINDNDEIDIDASEVERIDGSALQLLCALFSYANQNNLVIHWLKPSDALQQAADTLGLKQVLELNE